MNRGCIVTRGKYRLLPQEQALIRAFLEYHANLFRVNAAKMRRLAKDDPSGMAAPNAEYFAHAASALEDVMNRVSHRMHVPISAASLTG